MGGVGVPSLNSEEDRRSSRFWTLALSSAAFLFFEGDFAKVLWGRKNGVRFFGVGKKDFVRGVGKRDLKEVWRVW